MILAQTAIRSDTLGTPVILAALSLVVLAVVLSWALGLRVERQVMVATLRAALQLLAVGLLFGWIFSSDASVALAWAWVAVMVGVATVVIVRRAALDIRWLRSTALASVTLSTAITLATMFGFGVFEFGPVALVVLAGITIGNTVPSAVLGVDQAARVARERTGELEALLAFGFDRRQIIRFMAPLAARSGLIPQIERTKVVGLIALPGAMTGLLLAGVEPLEAVVIQLLVMYLVLGTVATCVVSLVALVTSSSVTDGLMVADWVRARN